MKPPTKFENMRRARDRAFYLGLRGHEVEAKDAAPWQQPPVPTMEVDGVKYREVPVLFGNGCKGCAWESVYCTHRHDVAIEAFGDSCGPRRVIYIKAE